MFRIRNIQRPSFTSPGTIGILLIFQFLEIGHDVLIAPARTATIGPGIVVGWMPSNMHHDIEIAAPTRNLAAWLVGAAPIETRLRNTYIAPIHRRTQQGIPQ